MVVGVKRHSLVSREMDDEVGELAQSSKGLLAELLVN